MNDSGSKTAKGHRDELKVIEIENRKKFTPLTPSSISSRDPEDQSEGDNNDKKRSNYLPEIKGPTRMKS